MSGTTNALSPVHMGCSLTSWGKGVLLGHAGFEPRRCGWTAMAMSPHTVRASAYQWHSTQQDAQRHVGSRQSMHVRYQHNCTSDAWPHDISKLSLTGWFGQLGQAGECRQLQHAWLQVFAASQATRAVTRPSRPAELMTLPPNFRTFSQVLWQPRGRWPCLLAAGSLRVSLRVPESRAEAAAGLGLRQGRETKMTTSVKVLVKCTCQTKC